MTASAEELEHIFTEKKQKFITTRVEGWSEQEQKRLLRNLMNFSWRLYAHQNA